MGALVSIIIPCYNYSMYVCDCLLSCINQSYDNVEIILVDDASADNSVEMAEKILDKRITIIKLKKNGGYSHAKNEGIVASNGKYIITLDCDDMMCLKGVEKRVTFLEANPDVEMVHALTYKFDGGWAYTKCLRKQHKMAFDRRCRIHAQSVCMPRKTYEKYGLYYEKMRSKSDAEMWMRLRLAGANIQKIDARVAFYRIHKNSMLAMRNRDKKYDKMITQMYNERIEQLKSEGITKANTRFM